MLIGIGYSFKQLKQTKQLNINIMEKIEYKYKIGDKLRIIGHRTGEKNADHGFKIGEIGTVVLLSRFNSSGMSYYKMSVIGNLTSCFCVIEEDLEPILQFVVCKTYQIY